MILDEPWTEAQRGAAWLLLELWSKHSRWPTYQWFEQQLRARGENPLELLLSFPTVGGPRGERQFYSAVEFERSVVPRPASKVCLTVAGLASFSEEYVSPFLALLRAASATRLRAVIDPFQETEVSFTSDDFAASQPNLPAELRAATYSLLENEPVVGLNGRGHSDDGSWRLTLGPDIDTYAKVHTVAQYLDEIRVRLTPPPAAPVRVLPSPVGLATALDYLDVTWRLHAGAPLLVLDGAARITSLAFSVGGEEEFQHRCSALAEIFKTMRVPGAAGVGGHPFERLSVFLETRLEADDFADALRAIDVLQAFRLVRVGQQHSSGVAGGMAALNQLGVPGPPFDWAAAWETVHSHVTQAVLDLRDATARVARPDTGDD